jgi:hypothetical protein
MTKLKKDDRKKGKQQYELVSPITLPVLARVLTHCGTPKEEGGKGYAANDWLKNTSMVDLISSAERHLTKFKLGQDFDEETGLPHVDLAFTNLMMLTHMYHLNEFQKYDDRGALGAESDFSLLEEVLK